jgi:hypothetical protein
MKYNAQVIEVVSKNIFMKTKGLTSLRLKLNDKEANFIPIQINAQIRPTLIGNLILTIH